MEGIPVARTLTKCEEIIFQKSFGVLRTISEGWMCFLKDLDDYGSIPEEAGAYISSVISQKHSLEVAWAPWGAQMSYRVIQGCEIISLINVTMF